jgi:hypothetical protein
LISGTHFADGDLRDSEASSAMMKIVYAPSRVLGYTIALSPVWMQQQVAQMQLLAKE